MEVIEMPKRGLFVPLESNDTIAQLSFLQLLKLFAEAALNKLTSKNRN